MEEEFKTIHQLSYLVGHPSSQGYTIFCKIFRSLDSNQRSRRIFKETDRLCKVVELGMQCCGKLLSDSFETF